MADLTAAYKALDVTKLSVLGDAKLIFFSHVALSLLQEMDESVPTACTNSKWIKYNPDFFLSLDREERKFLMLHEVFHVVLLHILRLMGYDVDSRDAKLWNMAGDYVINDYLILEGYKMPKMGLHDKKYRGMSTEEVFNSLKQEKKDESDEYNNFDMDMEKAEGSEEELKAAIDEILVEAAIRQEKEGRDANMLPLEVRRYIEGLLSPKLPWNRILNRFMNDLAKTDYTFRKPNRRYYPEHILPTRYSYGMEHIAVIIDASGSISKDQFTQFMSDTFHILKQFSPPQITVVQFGSTICRVDEVKTVNDLAQLKLVNGGGTCITPVIDWIKENKPKGVICFTDGWFEENNNYEELKVPTVWAIHTNKGFKKKFGIQIEYEL
jgi:predicted metal-dependent peptidase